MFLDKFRDEAPAKPQPKTSKKAPQPRRTKVLIFTLVLVVILAGGGIAARWYTTKQSEAGVLSNNSVGYNVNDVSSSDVANANASILTNNESAAFLDSDDDGLLDDLEDLYGTDTNAKDTDGDGFDDGTEVKNGFDPRVGSGSVRMVDLALVDRVAKSVAEPIVVSSGIATSTTDRYYLVYDGLSTSYFGVDGTLKAQCIVEEKPTGACATLPNEVRTDFSRIFQNGASTDVFHIPF